MIEPDRSRTATSHPALATARLYAILDSAYVEERHLGRAARGVIAGGADIVQFRAKASSISDIRSSLRYLRPFFEESGVPLIVNDHPALVLETFAAGVHVGQDDSTVAAARALAGPEIIVGKSTHSLGQIEAAAVEAPDYLAFGPLYATPTKPEYTPVGLGNIREAVRRAGRPMFCIGGIREANLDAVLDAGAERVVIVSELLQAPDIAAYVGRVKERLEARPLVAHD